MWEHIQRRAGPWCVLGLTLALGGCATGGFYRVDPEPVAALQARLVADVPAGAELRQVGEAVVRIQSDGHTNGDSGAELFAGEVVEAGQVRHFGPLAVVDATADGDRYRVIPRDQLLAEVARQAVSWPRGNSVEEELFDAIRARHLRGQRLRVTLPARRFSDGGLVRLRPHTVRSAAQLAGSAELELEARTNNAPLIAGYIIGGIASSFVLIGGAMETWGKGQCGGFVCIPERDAGEGLRDVGIGMSVGGVIGLLAGALWHPEVEHDDMPSVTDQEPHPGLIRLPPR